MARVAIMTEFEYILTRISRESERRQINREGTQRVRGVKSTRKVYKNVTSVRALGATVMKRCLI